MAEKDSRNTELKKVKYSRYVDVFVIKRYGTISFKIIFNLEVDLISVTNEATVLYCSVASNL